MGCDRGKIIISTFTHFWALLGNFSKTWSRFPHPFPLASPSSPLVFFPISGITPPCPQIALPSSTRSHYIISSKSIPPHSARTPTPNPSLSLSPSPLPPSPTTHCYYISPFMTNFPPRPHLTLPFSSPPHFPHLPPQRIWPPHTIPPPSIPYHRPSRRDFDPKVLSVQTILHPSTRSTGSFSAFSRIML